MKHSEDVKFFNEQVEKAMRAAIKEAVTQGVEIVAATYDMESDVMIGIPKEVWTSIEDAILAGNENVKNIVSMYDIATRQYHPAYVECMEKIADNLMTAVTTARVKKCESYTHVVLRAIRDDIDEVLGCMELGDGDTPENMNDDCDEVFERVEKES